MARKTRIEVYPISTLAPIVWFWHVRAANGLIVADGAESYASKSNALRAAKRFRELFSETVEIKERLP